MTKKKQRKIPIRTCIVCRTANNKRSLTRLVRTPDGVQIDLTGKKNGRGAYLCSATVCWEKATKHTQILSNALKATPTEDDISQLRQYLTDVIMSVQTAPETE